MDGRLTKGSREALKPRDSGLDLSNHSEIWQAPWQQRCQDIIQILERFGAYNMYLAASRLREILWLDVRPLSV